MAEIWNWPGARWWKADLHVHSPGSHDFRDGSASAAEWVNAAVDAGLDVVAVTDHNSGAFIDEVRRAAAAAGSRLAVFPGVELSVENVHVLALFDPAHDSDAVKALLGACQIPHSDWGKPEAFATCSPVDALAKIRSQGGLAVAAHVDDVKGIVREFGAGQTLMTLLSSELLHGAEVKDLDSPLLEFLDCSRPGYGPDHRPLAIITSSDAHRLSRIGSRFTWLKMTRPSIDGLRLALQDPEFSVRHEKQVSGDPNTHAALAIEGIEVRNGRFMGRSEPFVIHFNPWLNAIIGGRGTGKSTLLEFIRVAMRREDELPDALKEDFRALMRVPASRNDRGVLTEDTELRILIRKDEARFRIGWNQSATVPAIEQEAPDGTWVGAQGDVKSRFPIRIYSQKQIFELARSPGALLGVVDDASPVGHAAWRERQREEEARFLSLRAKAREIEAGLADEPRLRGELDDVVRRLAVFEAAGHSQILRDYQLRQRQQRAVAAWQEELDRTAAAMADAAAAVEPSDIEPVFDRTIAGEAEVLERIEETGRAFAAVRMELVEFAGRARAAADAARQRLADTAWARAAAAAAAAYEALVQQLRDEGAGDPSEFGRLVQNRQLIEARLREFESRRATLGAIHEQANASLERLRAIRREITASRADFLASVLEGNRHVRIDLIPYGADDLEAEFRRLIHCEGDVFQKDVDALLDYLRPPEEDSQVRQSWQERAATFEARLAAVKEHILAVARGAASRFGIRDQRFSGRLTALNPEVLDRVAAWFPDDSLRVSHSPGRDGARFQPIERGSPGQKTAALLAFLLSYGDEPMLLDQPEDDLDNHLIYDLIVRELRDVKRHRQMIIVTHNPNVVVNGDAELTVALHAPAGQTLIEQMGGLQEPEVREVICQVMEGGRAAFDLRYRRIRGGGPRV